MMGWAAGNYEERAVMNLQTWAKWVTEINELLGGADVKLSPGPFGGMKIGVRWMVGKELMGYEHAMSLVEMERMYEVVQPCVLEQITNAVRKMTPNNQVQAAPRSGVEPGTQS